MRFEKGKNAQGMAGSILRKEMLQMNKRGDGNKGFNTLKVFEAFA